AGLPPVSRPPRDAVDGVTAQPVAVRPRVASRSADVCTDERNVIAAQRAARAGNRVKVPPQLQLLATDESDPPAEEPRVAAVGDQELVLPARRGTAAPAHDPELEQQALDFAAERLAV